MKKNQVKTYSTRKRKKKRKYRDAFKSSQYSTPVKNNNDFIYPAKRPKLDDSKKKKKRKPLKPQSNRKKKGDKVFDENLENFLNERKEYFCELDKTPLVSKKRKIKPTPFTPRILEPESELLALMEEKKKNPTLFQDYLVYLKHSDDPISFEEYIKSNQYLMTI